MRLMTVLGARPQFIKASAVSRSIENRSDVVEQIVHTGQHYDANMSATFFEELGVPTPAFNLGVGSGGHGQQTGRMLGLLEEVMLKEKPDAVLVYGDTNSTLAGALTAVKLNIPVAHVEAGLRSFNRSMPEEINRVVTDHLSGILFAPTEVAVTNLAREGITGARVQNVGDVMYDVALTMRPRAEASSSILSRLGLQRGSYILATIHRAENTDDLNRLKNIIDALSEISTENDVVFPMHPRTKDRLKKSGLSLPERVRVIKPVGYIDMTVLCAHARAVATDSGGLQKEAFFHSVPCITLRNETEWTELIDLGWNRLAAPTSAETIIGAIRSVHAWLLPQDRSNLPYGNGNAADRIVSTLIDMVPTRRSL